MRIEIIDQNHVEGELDGHPDGADRGGYVRNISGHTTLCSQIGVIYFEYSYMDCTNYYENEKYTVCFDYHLSKYKEELDKFCGKFSNKNTFLDENAFINEFTSRFGHINIKVKHETVRKFIEWLNEFSDCFIQNGSIFIKSGNEEFDTDSLDLDLDDFIWSTDKFYFWYDSLSENEDVINTWNDLKNRVKEQEEVILDQIKAKANQLKEKQDMVLEKLHNAIKDFKEELADIPDEMLLETIRD